jgi:predicted metal-dependent enzyme (double-stranded beta helix superfamily)
MRLLTLPLLLAAYGFGQTTTAIDNEHVRVLVAHQKPHAKTPLHEHQFNRVMVYLQSFSESFTYPNKPPATMNFRAGEVEWSPAGGMHTAEIVSPAPVTIVEIELKKPGSKLSATGPLDPVVVDPKHYKVEFENDQVRVLRVRTGPHEATPVHQHALNRVVTYLTGQDFRVTAADGKVDHAQRKAGEVGWSGPATHKEENLSDHLFEVVVVELK